jgi:hypothetical protein
MVIEVCVCVCVPTVLFQDVASEYHGRYGVDLRKHCQNLGARNRSSRKYLVRVRKDQPIKRSVEAWRLPRER